MNEYEYDDLKVVKWEITLQSLIRLELFLFHNSDMK